MSAPKRKWFSTALPLVLCMAALSCGESSNGDSLTVNSEPIVGGYESTPGSRPYQVSLQYSGYHFCGGALLSPYWVLTAAHCTQSYSPSSMTVRSGVHRLSSNEGQIHPVSQIIIHPNYGSTGGGNDISLVRLSSSASASLTPLELPTLAMMNAAASPGANTVVSGWGALSEGGSSPDALHEVVVPVVSNSTCNASYGNIISSMICAGYAAGGKDSCQGDSGGPLVADYQGQTFSVGIVSWGEGCARPNKYGVYTRTYSFVDWINQYVQNVPPPTPTPTPYPTPTPSPNQQLSNGVPVSISGATGQWSHYYINVPSGVSNLVMTISGGTGDADLYTRFGAQPTSTSYDCRPYLSGNNEECTVANPQAGTYYVSAYGYATFSNVSLVASYAGVTPSPSPEPTPNPQPTPTPTPAPTLNSCEGYCGSQTPSGCWCDTQCEQYGDCCADKQQFCG